MSDRKAPIIQLQNPVAEHFGAFIQGNSVSWQSRLMADMEEVLDAETYAELQTRFEACRPGLAFAQDKTFHDFVLPFAQSRYVVRESEAKGQHLVICGAGPSLRETAPDYCPEADQVWGCNSALTWLQERGYKVTHGFTVDQTPHMCAEWRSMPDVEYLCASTIHPHLADMLTSAGKEIRYFNNFVGLKGPNNDAPVKTFTNEHGVADYLLYEDWLYALLFPPTVRAGSGLNATTRAIDVAQFMGFETITILGADCCLKVKGAKRMPNYAFNSKEHLRWLRKYTVMHADGGHALASEASPLTIHAVIDSGTPDRTVRPGHGRYWMTKVDMSISALWLVRMARASGGKIRLIGDTLPNAIMQKDEDFLLNAMSNFVSADGRVANIPVFTTDASHAAESAA